MLFSKKEKKSYPIPENNIVKVNKEELNKIQDALDALNAELLTKNNEKLRMVGARI